MKKVLIYAFALTSLSAFAAKPFAVECYASKAPHTSMGKFKINNFSEIFALSDENDGADLENQDARQYDKATVENGIVSLALNNGCENAFDFTFSAADYKKMLKGKSGKITVKLDYAFPDEENDQANEHGYLEGKLTATCYKR